MNRLIKLGAAMIIVAELTLAIGSLFLGHLGVRAASAAEKTARVSAVAGTFAPGAMPLGLPTEDTTKAVLDASLPHHHPQWVDVPMGSVKIHVFIAYPALPHPAPVPPLTAQAKTIPTW